MKNQSVNVVLAAGGNPTGIILMDDASNRDEYVGLARHYMASHPDIEQFGFIEGTSHFQMSGGEFCGNAARAAALLIAQKTKSDQGSFTMSGFEGVVKYRILGSGHVECVFLGLSISAKPISAQGIGAVLVDLGGIVHVVLPTTEIFKKDQSSYQTFHKKVTGELGLGGRAAVGVVWQTVKSDGSVAIHPVVWVRDIDSFFYETACGSGTLAVLEAGGQVMMDIVQPSGQTIHSEKLSENSYLLMSAMQILHD